MYDMHAWPPFSLLRSRICACIHVVDIPVVGAIGYARAIFTGYLKPLCIVGWTNSCSWWTRNCIKYLMLDLEYCIKVPVVCSGTQGIIMNH